MRTRSPHADYLGMFLDETISKINIISKNGVLEIDRESAKKAIYEYAAHSVILSESFHAIDEAASSEGRVSELISKCAVGNDAFKELQFLQCHHEQIAALIKVSLADAHHITDRKWP